MGLLSKLFGKKGEESKEESQPIYFAKEGQDKMNQAFEEARKTFKYFWREIYWENRRIVPALDIACVKMAFSQDIPGQDAPLVEHMWINKIYFDGEMVYGELMNTPNELTNVKAEDEVKVHYKEISDWMFSIGGKTYGGFTIQALRSDMSDGDRNAHDQAWGLDFGDFNDILIAYQQKENPDVLIEHPMSINMGESMKEFLSQNPAEAHTKNEEGYTLLHREVIAGNKTSVDILKNIGIDLTVKTNDGKTALDFAKELAWEHILPVLED